MRKFLTKFVVFVAVIMIAYPLMVVLYALVIPLQFQPTKLGKYGHMYTRLREIDSQKDIDILFLGSSHCYRGFDPRIFAEHGFTSFNLGSSSQSPIQTEILLSQYLDLVNPRIVVYEVCPMEFSTDGVESSLDIMSNSAITATHAKLAIQQNHMKIYNNLIYSYFRQITGIDDPEFEELNKEGEKYIPGGYIEKEKKAFQNLDEHIHQLKSNEDQYESFDRIVKMIRKKNIQLVLVQAPVASFRYKTYDGIAQFDSLMSGYSSYFNFNEILQLEDSLHFYDSHHLNQEGVNIFNEELIRISDF